MNKEFKKIKGKMETRYVLEAASAGATSAGAVATGPVAKKDNLLVQGKDEKPEVQRRNPVAANVNATVGGGGSGAHKDRKKAEKRGERKHRPDWKKDIYEDEDTIKKLEQLESAYRQAKGITKEIKYDNTAQDIIVRIRTLGDKVGLTDQDFYSAENEVFDAVMKLESAVYGLDEVFKDTISDLKSAMDIDEDYGVGGYMTATGGAQVSKAVPEADIDPGYIDQENSMTASDLKSLYKQAVKLRNLIQKMGDDTTLEPWQQTKIAKASDYVNAVFRSLDNEYGLDSLEEKIKGADGKACWTGYRYAGTKDGKDKCIPVNEEQKKGLWANIHARRKKGLPPRKPGEKGAPSKKSWDTAVAVSKTKKKKNEAWKDDIYGSGKDNISNTRETKPKYYYFYDVPENKIMLAWAVGLKKTYAGKWYNPNVPNEQAEKYFGRARMWKPKAEESMMPVGHFAGTPKNKLGPAAHLKGKMKRAARQGDLVGSAEEGYSKKKLK